MDDFNVSSLHESKNEWAARLITILTPLIIEGFKSIFEESYKLCKDNGELDKYLMTFQNFIARIPKWNPTIITQEKIRIVEKSSCNYLEELVTCVHIIQLKILTTMRVGQKQKKIDINIPKLDDFIHKTYINCARKIYKNVYLYESGIQALLIQKHQRELEIIIQECILNTVRESIPVESILRAYLDETTEEEIVEEIKEQNIVEPRKEEPVSVHVSETSSVKLPEKSDIAAAISKLSTQTLKFNDVDRAMGVDFREESINAPKNLERLEEISNIRNTQRKLEEDDDDEDDDKIHISDQNISLTDFDIHNIDDPVNMIPDLLFEDIEILS